MFTCYMSIYTKYVSKIIWTKSLVYVCENEFDLRNSKAFRNLRYSKECLDTRFPSLYPAVCESHRIDKKCILILKIIYNF